MEEALQFWLLHNGFDTNPFASKEADFEVASDQSRVVDYFVRAVWVDQILGDAEQPRSALLAARRGFGKSASRLMVEYECRQGRMADRVLAATYTSFERALAAHRGESSLSLHDAHLVSVIETCCRALLDYLRQYPKQIVRLGQGGSFRLEALLAKYTNLFDPFELDEILRRVNADEKVLNSKSFLRAVKGGNLGELLDVSNLGPERPWLELIGQAAAYDGATPEPGLRLVEDIARLGRLVGLRAIYVLVDRVDELPETAANPAAGAELLRPLLANLRLMEVPGLAFKFFLPDEVVALLFSAPELRPDRLTRYEINWTESQLLNFLHNRLLAYSRDNSLGSLAPFCDLDFADEVDEEIARRAEGSPRNLLRLGELFIMEHCSGPEVDGPLLREELERAHQKLRASLQQERAAYSATPGEIQAQAEKRPVQPQPEIPQSGLYLDTAKRQVWRDGQLLEPGPVGQEYTLLEYLYKNVGRAISKDELLRAIYGGNSFVESSEEALAQMVSRLRKKIEPAPRRGDPVYIITVPRFGYKLENPSPSIPS
jgi:DNA-binding winged helix-turn-helix (wHTH) protein